MLTYNIAPLSKSTEQGLTRQQAKVDAATERQAQYDVATGLFKSKSPKGAFNEVRVVLDRFSPPIKSCFYCERDRYRDIDHVWPKRHYPEKSFRSENYVYSCTICTQDAKNDRFATFDANDNIIEFDRSLSFNAVVPSGPHVLIDIRHEDPLDFLQIDLSTGLHVPIGANARDQKRGIYTRDLFKLDSDALSKYRRSAYKSFVEYLRIYNQALDANDFQKAQRALSEIQEHPFPTVLVEMRRQATAIGIQILFDRLPPDVGKR